MNGKAKHEIVRLVELLIIVGFTTIPLFILASEIDDDEFWKTFGAVGIAGVAGLIMAAYRLWKGSEEKKDK